MTNERSLGQMEFAQDVPISLTHLFHESYSISLVGLVVTSYDTVVLSIFGDAHMIFMS
jgi:hypothetical protein